MIVQENFIHTNLILAFEFTLPDVASSRDCLNRNYITFNSKCAFESCTIWHYWLPTEARRGYAFPNQCVVSIECKRRETVRKYLPLNKYKLYAAKERIWVPVLLMRATCCRCLFLLQLQLTYHQVSEAVFMQIRFAQTAAELALFVGFSVLVFRLAAGDYFCVFLLS